MLDAWILAQVAPRRFCLDLGDQWLCSSNACVATHIRASLADAGLTLDADLQQLVTGRLLDITPRRHAPPYSLLAVHEKLIDLKVCICIRYFSDLGGQEFSRAWLGDVDGGVELLPIYVSIAGQHCYLGLEHVGRKCEAHQCADG